MTTTSPIGTLRLSVDGEWDIEDLRSLAESLSESYGLFYPLVSPDNDVRDRLQDILRKNFWSGDIETSRVGIYLYRQIPKEDSLRLKSFSYASPGAMEITGALAALLMLSRVAQSWIKTAEHFLVLWEKVDKFFAKRRNLRRPPKRVEMNEDTAESVEEARKLVFEVGNGLGFDAISCERLIDINGNPISALKYLVAAGKEGRKIAQLQQQGKLTLPQSGESISLQSSTTPTRRRKSVDNATVRSGIKPRRNKSQN